MEMNSKYIILENTRHVAVAPLEQRRTVNYEWNIIICLPVIPQDIRIGWITAEDGSLSLRQCKLSLIGSSNCFFEQPKQSIS